MNVSAMTSAEGRLLLLCSRTRLDASVAEQVRDLVAEGVDWTVVLALASDHGVLPLLYSSLGTMDSAGIPPTVLAELRERFTANARRGLILTSRLLSVLARFRAANIPVIPFKGPTLARGAYGSTALRQFTDLDLLVRPSDVPAARRLLLEEGYCPRGFQSEWEWNLENREGVAIDLHQAIASPYDPVPDRFDDLWARRSRLTLGASPVETFSPEDLLLILSIQLVKDCRERRQRLVQLCDIAEVIRAWPSLDYRSVVRRAHASRAERILHLALGLANRVLGAVIPDSLQRSSKADPVAESLVQYARERLLHRVNLAGPNAEVGLLHEDTRFYLRAREHWADKAAYLGLLLRNLFRLAVTPTVKDRTFLPLPAALRFLHYFSRPVRVIVARRERGRPEDGERTPDH